jgi:hypothetical protein
MFITVPLLQISGHPVMVNVPALVTGEKDEQSGFFNLVTM